MHFTKTEIYFNFIINNCYHTYLIIFFSGILQRKYISGFSTGALIFFFCLQGIDLYKHIDVL